MGGFLSKKKHAHEEHVNHERWLVSYADFITLLFAFFVVLFSSSQVDRSKTNKMSLAMEAAFSTFSLFKEQAGTLNLMSANGKKANASVGPTSMMSDEDSQPLYMSPEILDAPDEAKGIQGGKAELNENSGVPVTETQALNRAQHDLMSVISHNELKGSVNLGWDERGLVISVRDAAFFEMGADKLTPDSKLILANIARVVQQMPNQVRIEGHTDTENAIAPYASNWELSTARATHVVEWLIQDYGVKPERLVAVGYGQFRPIADNRTEAGRLRNRRIDIVILSTDAAKKEAPLSGTTENQVHSLLDRTQEKSAL